MPQKIFGNPGFFLATFNAISVVDVFVCERSHSGSLTLLLGLPLLCAGIVISLRDWNGLSRGGKAAVVLEIVAFILAAYSFFPSF